MSVRLYSAGITGVDAQLIDVEVDSSPGIHSFNIVGLPDKAVEESKDRIASAIKNSGFTPPNSKNKKIIINLAPADIRKGGPSYDLPIAIGYLLETRQIKFDSSAVFLAGELSLDGSVKSTNGILSMAILAKEKGLKEAIVPYSNIREAAIVEGLDVIGVKSLVEAISHLDRTNIITRFTHSNLKDKLYIRKLNNNPGFLAIKGQQYAKRALIVAAAGAHNILMSGPPGSGKTLLAKALTDILPDITATEAIEVAKIYSSVGMINGSPLNITRPFRNPHHTTSPAAVIGGGAWPKPGEISLAHRGVLFLDELPEFPRNVLESLRQPLEDGTVTVSRAAGSITLPAKFMLVAAMNPCPCGNLGTDKCLCAPYSVIKYRKKISGPLLDRIDLKVNVSRETLGESSTTLTSNLNELTDIKDRIALARKMQGERFKGIGIFSNAEMDFKNVEILCDAKDEAKSFLKSAINSRGLSMRSYHKILKISRTIADLTNSLRIEEEHVAEALNFSISEDLYGDKI